MCDLDIESCSWTEFVSPFLNQFIVCSTLPWFSLYKVLNTRLRTTPDYFIFLPSSLGTLPKLKIEMILPWLRPQLNHNLLASEFNLNLANLSDIWSNFWTSSFYSCILNLPVICSQLDRYSPTECSKRQIDMLAAVAAIKLEQSSVNCTCRQLRQGFVSISQCAAGKDWPWSCRSCN